MPSISKFTLKTNEAPLHIPMSERGAKVIEFLEFQTNTGMLVREIRMTQNVKQHTKMYLRQHHKSTYLKKLY